MLKRIVKLTIKKENCEAFLLLFNTVKADVRKVDGMHWMKLFRDNKKPNVFFTISMWDTEKELEAYRMSPLFLTVWPQIKALLSEKAEAWSLIQED
jgi:quinol monooxygenase YgiN